MMATYNMVCDTQKDKYDALAFLRGIGAKITDVSGYFDKYIIHFNATKNIALAIEDALASGRL